MSASGPPPPPLPPHLQAMMQQMQQRQPKFQQSQQQQQQGANRGDGRGGGGFQGGRGRGGGRRRGGRGGGRGGRHNGDFQRGNYGPRQHQHGQQSHFKRKRGPSDDVKDPARFFLPSCLEDPWRYLEGRGASNHSAPPASQPKGNDQSNRRAEVRPRQQSEQRPGRALFQPSFLQDPWVSPFFLQAAVPPTGM